MSACGTRAFDTRLAHNARVHVHVHGMAMAMLCEGIIERTPRARLCAGHRMSIRAVAAARSAARALQRRVECSLCALGATGHQAARREQPHRDAQLFIDLNTNLQQPAHQVIGRHVV
eukprot:6711835-Prymnesium_polylepis.1